MDEGDPVSPATLTVGELLAQTEKLLAGGSATQAVALAAIFLDKAERPALLQRKVIYADVLQKAGRPAEAITCLRSVEADLPAPQRLKLATLLLQEGQPAAAVAALPTDVALRETSRNPAPVLFACLRVLMAGDEITRARILLQALSNDLTAEHPLNLWMEFGRCGFELGLLSLARQAVEHILDASGLTAKQLATSIFWLRCSLADGGDSGAIDAFIPRIERHLALLGWPRDASLAYVKCLLAAGRPQKAASILERDFPEPETEQFLMQRVLMKIELKEREAAIALARAALADAILTPVLRQSMALLLSRLLVQDGKLAEAAATLEAVPGHQDNMAISRDLFTLRRKLLPPEQFEQLRTKLAAAEVKKLPGSLKAALSEISSPPRPGLARTLGTIRELWDYQDQDVENWGAWSARFDWGKEAAALLRQWALYADEEKKQDLRDLLAPVDTGPLYEALSQRRGAIVVGTHMGPLAAAFFLLEQLDRPFRFISAGGVPVRTKSEGIELATGTRSQSVRQSIAHLKKGGLLGMTTDVVNAGAFEVLELAKLRLRVSVMPARLSWKFAVPTVWCQSEWIDGAVQVSFQPLPYRIADEPEDVFVGRWLARHAEILRALLQGAPENLSGLQLLSGMNPQVSIVSTMIGGHILLGK